MDGVIKQIRKFIAAGNTGEAEKLVPEAYKAIDKSEKRGVIKANTAARKKSRLVSSIKKVK